MAEDLQGKNIAIVATDGVERIELEEPRGALRGAGARTLVEADAVRGRRMTSWPSVRTDLRNARAEVVDEEVVIDGQFTTSRSPADLPAFCTAIVEQFAKASHEAVR
jgi:putative intracellular protease/amidase